jgi:hypothetical protein
LAGLGLLVASRARRISVLNAAPAETHGAAQRARPTGVPVLVELFTSEGCSSCPPADAVLANLERTQPVRGAWIVPLAFHVDYWDGLGWPDPFAAPSFTARQRDYASLGAGLYTPQAVIDGRADVVGSRTAALERAIAEAAALPHRAVHLAVRSKDRTLDLTARVEPSTGAASDVFFALVQNAARQFVPRGENAGKTLHHTAIVRHFVNAGRVGAQGGEVRTSVSVPHDVDDAASLRIVAFVQLSDSRQIVGSAIAP